MEALEGRNLLAPVADIVDVAPDPRSTAVAAVEIRFTDSETGQPTNVTGVNAGDFTLRRNGVVVPLAANLLTGSGAAYSLNLAGVTSAAGSYELKLNAAGSGITDGGGAGLAADASDAWVTETTAPTANIVDVTPDPRRTPVGNVSIVFSEAVTGVNISDFRLTRNGTSVPLAGLVVNGSGTSYTLDLSTVTDGPGDYTLTLVAAGSGITDAAGNALAGNASDSWSFDDEREQNDTLKTAWDLGRLRGPVALGNLVLADSNDWFRFTTISKGTAADKIVLKQIGTGNLDIQLYNVAGQRVRSAATNGTTETISLNGLKVGTYYIRVFGRAGATNDHYELNINYRGKAASRVLPPGKVTTPNSASRSPTDLLGLLRFGDAPSDGRPVRKFS